MRIGLPTDVARVGTNETISGLWTFANALGLLTDVIGERTLAAGVTIDGVLLRDGGAALSGVLDLGDDLELSESNVSLATGSFNDQATGTTTVLRVTLPTGVVTITGFAGGRLGRIMCVVNLGGSALTLADADVGSVAANRMLFRGAADHVLAERDIAIMWYDFSVLRWKLLASTV